jgi:hypothetical protein
LKFLSANSSGFVLIIVLIFIAILSEIMISMQNSTLLQNKVIKDFSVYSRRIHLSDIVFEKAYEDILEENENCIDRWCLMQGNFLKNREILSYIITYLQTIPCLQIRGSKKTGCDFFKVLSHISGGNDDLKIERTFVVESKKNIACQSEFKLIDSGYLSWRIVVYSR